MKPRVYAFIALQGDAMGHGAPDRTLGQPSTFSVGGSRRSLPRLPMECWRWQSAALPAPTWWRRLTT